MVSLLKSTEMLFPTSAQEDCVRYIEKATIDFIKDLLHNTRLAVDSVGHLCTVPASMQVGDTIYLLAGSTVPIVLRPVAHETRHLFKVVGPAYVHGIMDGELVYDSPKRVSTGEPDAYDAAFDDIWLC